MDAHGDQGVQGYFNDMRIAPESVPEWFHFWELADGDSDGTPCRYEPRILVNFYGTFITTGELPVDYDEWTEGFIDSDGAWGFTGGGRPVAFDEVVGKELERMAGV
nr:LPD28 domain-containing protein [uncultured Acetatifactor sp.]